MPNSSFANFYHSSPSDKTKKSIEQKNKQSLPKTLDLKQLLIKENSTIIEKDKKSRNESQVSSSNSELNEKTKHLWTARSLSPSD